MKNIVLSILILLCSCIAASSSQTIIIGKVLGGDGKPLPLAEIRHGNKIEKAAPDGSFSINTDKEAAKLTFSAPYHFEYILDMPVEKGKHELNVLLSPFSFTALDSFFIIGEFNSFKINDNHIKMTKIDDGKFFARIPNTKDTLLYQIVSYDIKGLRGGRSFNGTQANFFVNDGSGDYRSGIITNDKEVEVVFDPQKFTSLKSPDKNIVTQDKYILEYFDLIPQSKRLLSRFKRNFWGDYDNNKGDNAANIKAAYLDTIITLAESAKSKIIKNNITAYLIELYGTGMTFNEVDNKKAKSLINALLKNVKPDSDFWSTYRNHINYAVELTGNPLKSKYLASLIENHPDTTVKQSALSSLIRFLDFNKDTVNLKKYYKIYMERYPYSFMASTLKRKYAEQRVIEIGKFLPDFKIKNLDNDSDVFTPASFKGKYVLFDFWGTWCGPCLNEMSNLDSAYNTFRNRNFTIFSLGLETNPNSIARFREGKWKMPWMHAFVNNWQDPICDVFQITSVPTCFLINPEGKIIAMQGELRGEKLFETLNKLIPQKQAN